jgi:hypothetical protein
MELVARGGFAMKARESGMPDESQWGAFFNPA